MKIRDYRKQILENAEHVDIVMLSGGVSSTDTLLRRLSDASHPILGIWVSLPNREDNEARRSAIVDIRKHVAVHYPTRDFVFADFMVKSEHETEDFGPVEVTFYSTFLYDTISHATVYWSTCSERWADYNHSKVMKMAEMIEGINNVEITGIDESIERQKSRIDDDLLRELV